MQFICLKSELVGFGELNNDLKCPDCLNTCYSSLLFKQMYTNEKKIYLSGHTY